MSNILNFNYNLALGLPLKRTDIQHLYDKIAEMEAVYGRLAGQGAVRLEGVDISVSSSGSVETTSYSAGWIYYGGQMLQVDASSVSRPLLGPDIPVWVAYEINGPHEPHLLDDFQTAHVFTLTRKARLQLGPAGGQGVQGYMCDWNQLLKPFKETSDRLDAIESGYSSWQPVITASGGQIQASTSTGERSWNYSRIGRKVTLSFYQIFLVSAAAVPSIAFSLPPGISIDFAFQAVVPVSAKRSTQSAWQLAFASLNTSGQASNAGIIEISTSPSWDIGFNNGVSGQIEFYMT